MTKEEISTVLMALKNICKKNDFCSKCVLYRTCYPPNYSSWSNDDINLMTNVLKDFIDEKEIQDNG